jgi:hypothetical protein
LADKPKKERKSKPFCVLFRIEEEEATEAATLSLVFGVG